MKGKCATFLLVFLSAVLLASCDNNVGKKPVPSGGTDKPAYGDSLVDGTIGEPSNLIPVLATDSASFDIAGLVYNGLLKYDKNLQLVGDLAKSWDVSKNGLVITFHLRHGVKWQDGVEFTARDVLYTYRVTIDPKTPTAYAENFKQVKKAEVVDPYTFRVTYD
ncbi:MAG: ABC transporter substrate-binding protein, partial [Geobacteraceae bacterium]